MRVDISYIKDILDRVLDQNKADFNLNLIKEFWPDGDDEKREKLVFHMEIMQDQGLIERSIEGEGIGFRKSFCGSNYTYDISLVPLRLTAAGHDFAAALNKPGVIDSLMNTFKDAGPGETVKAVFKISGNILDNQLKKLTGE